MEIVVVIATIVGIVAGFVQLLDYFEKKRGEKQQTILHKEQATDHPVQSPASLMPEKIKRENNLPLPLTSLIGRDQEISTIEKLLIKNRVRLLTITGPGGVGKTRIALKVVQNLVDEFDDGIYFVALGNLRDYSLVIPTIAQVLPFIKICEEELSQQIVDYLKPKKLMLVLDNFEQVIKAAPQIVFILIHCPKLSILVTSRIALRLNGEHEFPVSLLKTPDLLQQELSLEELAKCESVMLFVERAKAVKPDFSLNTENLRTISEICAHLDGLPLAIELTAVRVKSLPLHIILSKLNNRLSFLTRGQQDSPERQQTLQATIAWSYDLLNAWEQILFARLSVFVGIFTSTAAEAIVGENYEKQTMTTMQSIFSRTDRPLDSSVPMYSIEENIQPGSILIVTVTKLEVRAVRDVFSAKQKVIRRVIGEKNYYYLGVHGGVPVYMVQTEMIAATVGGALPTVFQAIQDLRPQAVIMCGIAYGLRPDKQHLGDLLISKQVQNFEPQKIDMQRGQIPRGDRVAASERLLDRFRTGDNDWNGVPTHFGLVLSGEKLVNNPMFREWLLKTEPEAIGGEMEGSGLYIAARSAEVDWIMVKAICDWADGTKNESAQLQAAHNAANFVLHVLRLGGWGELGVKEAPVPCAVNSDLFPAQVENVEQSESFSSLVESNLLIQVDRTEKISAFRMLEAFREFAEECLRKRNEIDIFKQRHAEFFLSMAEDVEPLLGGRDQLIWLDRLEQNIDNFRAALDWLIENEETEYGLRLAGALGIFWLLRGYRNEAPLWLDRIIALDIKTHRCKFVQAKALRMAGIFKLNLHDFAQADRLFQKSLDVSIETENQLNAAWAKLYIANLNFVLGKYQAVEAKLDECLSSFRKLGDKKGVALCLRYMGDLARIEGKLNQASILLEESLGLFRELGDRWGIALCSDTLGALARDLGAYEKAIMHYEECKKAGSELNDRLRTAISLVSLGEIAYCRGEYDQAEALCNDRLCADGEINKNKRLLGRRLLTLGNIAFMRGRYNEAKKFYEESLVAVVAIEEKRYIARCLLGIGKILCVQGEMPTAISLLAAASNLLAIIGATLMPLDMAQLDRHIQIAKSELSDDIFAKAWTQGLERSLDQTIVLVLEQNKAECNTNDV